MKKLSKRATQILDYLDNYIRKNGYSPTLMEIKNGIPNNKSMYLVQYTLDNLETRGLIKRITTRRPIMVIKKGDKL